MKEVDNALYRNRRIWLHYLRGKDDKVAADGQRVEMLRAAMAEGDKKWNS